MLTKKIKLPVYHDRNFPLSLGCTPCPELGLCGGLFAANGNFSCLGFCDCEDSNSCNYVCRSDSRIFALRSMEVRGFSFDNVLRCPVIAPPQLPLVVPVIYHKSARSSRLQAEAVAVRLDKLFHHKTGALKFTSREALAARFGFDPNARLILVGINRDSLIEPYWSVGRAAKIYNALSALQPDLVTTPNFSTFANVPRWDNFYGMKRILIAWSELVTSGIPTSLHLNARTDRDWERWTEFIAEREEVQSIALEFKTGAAVARRGRYVVEKLLHLVATVPRELQLVIEGGRKYLRELRQGFQEVIFIDTTSHVKTFNRQKLIYVPGKRDKWLHFPTPVGQPLDELFQHNVIEFAKSVTRNSEIPFSLPTASAVNRISLGT